jgi:ubiquinone/menaquinone biosynthesis C-methylase UbiE
VFGKLKEIIYRQFLPTKHKELHELSYWRHRVSAEGSLANDHYTEFYTAHFDLSPDDYTGMRVLDVGCGPRGSLEWAGMAAERVGLDPLAGEYLKLGAARHKMRYVAAPSEEIPFPDAHFDFVCSFNSLDHVANLRRTASEITRVTKQGGVFLLLVDVNHDPTVCEPNSFSWDVVRLFTPQFDILSERHYEKKADGMYDSIKQNLPYDEGNSNRRYGILSAKFRRR